MNESDPPIFGREGPLGSFRVRSFRKSGTCEQMKKKSKLFYCLGGYTVYIYNSEVVSKNRSVGLKMVVFLYLFEMNNLLPALFRMYVYYMMYYVWAITGTSAEVTPNDV